MIRSLARPTLLSSLIIMATGVTSNVAAATLARAGYVPNTGSLYLYVEGPIGVVGFEDVGRFNPSKPAFLGARPPQQYDADVLAWFDPAGLPTGLYLLGHSLLPPGTTGNLTFGYTPVGGPEVTNPASLLIPTEASARYNRVTGELLLDVAASPQALLVGASVPFNTGATPTLGALAPKQFDAANLMFFNAGSPLPVGAFNLGAVLPPNLTASQIQFTGVTDGVIHRDLQVTVVPEPPTTLIAASLVAASSSVGIKRARRHRRPFVPTTLNLDR